MENNKRIPGTLRLTIASVLAALTMVLLIAPLPAIGYVNIAAVMEVIGAVGASTGLLGALGVTSGALIYSIFRPSEMFLQLGFLPMASGALSIALLMHRKAATTTLLLTLLLVLFFQVPGNVYVPLWALWDKFIALLLIYPTVYLIKKSFTSKGIGGDANKGFPRLQIITPLVVVGLIVAALLIRSLGLDNGLMEFIPQIPLIYSSILLALYLSAAVYLLRGVFLAVLLLSFIGLEIDCMVGNILFGAYGYSIYAMTAQQVADLYTPFAIGAGAERLITALIATYITLPLLVALESNPRLRWLIHRE
ncbi:MAG: hypothetical protein B6U72_01850 [Candidatus Altiarchaeales archaeon ex4484_2]|nr:MAG: hypothetical protein B6U72_01850 [Candidatus Altiarchaeales archaeon ex4484_2]